MPPSNKHAELATSEHYRPVDHWVLMHGQASLTLVISLSIATNAMTAVRELRNSGRSDLDHSVEALFNILCVICGISSIFLVAAPAITWANVLQHRATSFYDRVWPPLVLERSQTIGTYLMVMCVIFYMASLIASVVGFGGFVFFAALVPVLAAVVSACYAINQASSYLLSEEAEWPELVPLSESRLSGRSTRNKSD